MTAVVPLPAAGDPLAEPAQHDSDVWETVGGWVFGCRTCLEHEVYDVPAAAMERKRLHDMRALPWWATRIRRTT